jgi:Flp pilus assembly protein protease CpaA
LILKDTAPEIMGIIMVVCLAAFLSSTEHTKLTSVTYMAATMFVPLQLALFFQKSTMGCSQVNPNHVLGLARQFPISVVFHVITTLCCILMEHQMRVRMDDLREIRNLRVRIKEKVQEAKKSK